MEQALDVSGTFKFQANTTVAAEVSAQIESIDVADGQFVEAGDILLTFDEAKIRQTASEAAANLQRDEALLTFHKAEWEKNKALHESGSISQTQYDQKLSAYQTALAQVEADKALLAKALEDQAKTKVKAPISGVVSKRYVEKGDWVSPGGKLFQISEFNRIYLEAFITDVDLGKLPLKKIRETGLTCTLTVDSYPGAQYSGNLSYVQPVANDMRLFEIRIYLANPDMNLLQGMVGRARIVYAVTPEVLRIPLRALLDDCAVTVPTEWWLWTQNRKPDLRQSASDCKIENSQKSSRGSNQETGSSLQGRKCSLKANLCRWLLLRNESRQCETRAK